MSKDSFISMYCFHFVNADNLCEVHLVFINECGLHYKNLEDFFFQNRHLGSLGSLWTTRCYIAEDTILHNHRCENFKLYKCLVSTTIRNGH
jgi:hypothetical protein